MRRSTCILAPIFIFAIMGLIGIDVGHAAQAKAHGKKGAQISKAAAHARQGIQKKHTHASKKIKKARSGKKKIKAVRHRHRKGRVLAAKGHRGQHVKHARILKKHKRQLPIVQEELAMAPEVIEETGSPEPVTDLWLAKASQEREIQAAQEPESQPDGLTLKILESAHSYLGTRYRFGGNSPEEGFDCSGFVQHVFGENGIALGRSSREQARQGMHVPLSALKPGDLIFFNMRHRKHPRIDHVGLYIGDGQFIHAASSRSRQIKIEDLKSVRYQSRVVTTRRIIQ